MLVKIHSRTYADDYGLLVKGERPYIHMFESGIVRLTGALKPHPVVKVNAIWMDKDLKVGCKIASTDEEKREGLQGYTSLETNEGLYFPYPGYCDVTFHQGSVSFPLDVLFLRDGEVLKVQARTAVGGSDRWSCEGCDGVIEVNAGFCEENSVDPRDRILLSAYSERDICAYLRDREAIKEEEDWASRGEGLVHSIIGEDDL